MKKFRILSKKRKAKSFLFLLPFILMSTSLFAQQAFFLPDNVTDYIGTPLENVSVLKKGSQVGIISASNGNFTLNANTGDILVFSIVGFQPKEVRVEPGG